MKRWIVFGPGSTWVGDCRVMCTMEYLTQKNATDPLFPLEHAELLGEHFRLLFVFSTRRLEASHTRLRWLGIALKLRPKLRQVGEAWSQCRYMYTCELFTCRPTGNEER